MNMSYGTPIVVNPDPNDPNAKIAVKDKKIVKRVSRACVPCQRGHLSCDSSRPCKKCWERDRECFDGEPRRRGKKKNDDATPLPDTRQELQQINQTNPEVFQQLLNETTLYDQVNLLRENAVMDLPQDSLDLFSAVFFTPYDNPKKRRMELDASTVQSPAQQTPIVESVEYLIQHIDLLKKTEDLLQERIPHVYSETKRYQKDLIRAFNSLKKNHLDSFNDECMYQMLQEVERIVRQLRMQFETQGVPVIIWEKGSAITYANPAFRRLTGLDMVLPSDPYSMSFLKQLDDEGLAQFTLGGLISMVTEGNDFTINAAFLNHKSLDGGYIPGTLSVNIIKLNDLPVLFVGYFLPSVVPKIQTSDLSWDGWMEMMKQCCDISNACEKVTLESGTESSPSSDLDASLESLLSSV
eukprot:TRINITY_DN4660_c0_g1_i1.p1 TRINITY_DN4660_c0_g1~~TRINITY_DN4660_c0_g1_i1.p1  ORF type:complete len:410 (-),score=78.49 TRINITY_DN4660_c0_g1_i1:22-1251(-)